MIGVFGPGILIATRTDITPATPYGIGFGQSFSLSNKSSNKQLFGQDRYPLLIGPGTIKTSGKFVAAKLSGQAANSIFFGLSFTSGGVIWNINEQHSVPASSPYTITVTNSATYSDDLGVIYESTGLPLTKVTSGPTVGQYSEASGVYTFAAADEGVGMGITYRSTTTGGQTLGVTNQPIGTAPTFQLDYYTSFNQPTAQAFIVRVYYCVAGGYDLDFKLEDFMMPSFDFEYAALANGKVFDLIFPDVG
jgi:hypothetical protein